MTGARTPRRLALVNPNTDRATTAAMLSIARDCLPDGVVVDGLTAPFGAPLILDAAALAVAAEAVVALSPRLRSEGYDGVVVSAFGDPGLEALRTLLPCPVSGLAEASLAQAAKGSRRCCVVTTTPGLAELITATAHRYGHGPLYAGTFCTAQEPRSLMGDAVRLEAALFMLCKRVVACDRVQAIIIGGGPLSAAARALRPRIPVPVIEPIPAAVAAALKGYPAGGWSATS